MALTHSTAVRNGIADYVTDQVDGGTIEILTGADLLLATLTLSNPSAPAASNGVATFSTITPDSAADNTGTAAKAQIKSSGGTPVITGLVVGVGTGDIQFATVSFVSGATISITSLTYTAPT